MPLVCPSVNMQMYAHDTVICVHGKNKPTAAMVHGSDWLRN